MSECFIGWLTGRLEPPLSGISLFFQPLNPPTGLRMKNGTRVGAVAAGRDGPLQPDFTRLAICVVT
jgi:hypothetical protein